MMYKNVKTSTKKGWRVWEKLVIHTQKINQMKNKTLNSMKQRMKTKEKQQFISCKI